MLTACLSTTGSGMSLPLLTTACSRKCLQIWTRVEPSPTSEQGAKKTP